MQTLLSILARCVCVCVCFVIVTGNILLCHSSDVTERRRHFVRMSVGRYSTNRLRPVGQHDELALVNAIRSTVDRQDGASSAVDLTHTRGRIFHVGPRWQMTSHYFAVRPSDNCIDFRVKIHDSNHILFVVAACYLLSSETVGDPVRRRRPAGAQVGHSRLRRSRRSEAEDIVPQSRRGQRLRDGR